MPNANSTHGVIIAYCACPGMLLSTQLGTQQPQPKMHTALHEFSIVCTGHQHT